MGTRVSADTMDKYWQLVDLIKEEPRAHSVTSAANRLHFATSTVSRFTATLPWMKAFTKDEVGLLDYSGELPFSTHTRATLSKALDKRREEVYNEVSDPLAPIVTALHNHLAKSKGEPFIEEALLTGEQLKKLVVIVEEVVERAARKLDGIKAQPNYGRDEWWLDHVN